MTFKMLWCSDSWMLPTGYSQVTRNLLSNFFKAGVEVHNLSFQNVGFPSNMVVGERMAALYRIYYQIHPNESYGNAGSVEFYNNEIKPDVTAFLADSFMIRWIADKVNHEGKEITKRQKLHGKTLFYFPFDSHDVYDGVVPVMEQMDIRVAMSKYAQNLLKTKAKIDSHYIPHGVDPVIYRPLPPQIVKKVRDENKWGDKFVVGCVARNQSRKNIPALFKAFAEFAKDKDTILLMHCDPVDPQGTNLYDLANKLGIADKVTYGMRRYSLGVPEFKITLAYNMMDIHVLSTCYHPKTQISTNKGFNDIANIEIGDEVFTSDGTFRKVDDIKSYEYDGDLLEVSTSYNPSVKVTPNHRVFGIKCKNKCNYTKNKIKKDITGRIKLKRMDEFSVGDYLVVPRIKKIEDRTHIIFDKSYISNQTGITNKEHPNHLNIGTVDIDNDLMWLFGYYLAEGCISQTREKPEGIVFCCSTKEDDYTEKVKRIMRDKFNLDCNIYDTTRHRRTIRIYNSSLGRKFKELFGSGAKNKNIPEWILYLPKEKQKHLINGYFSGDGHEETDNRTGSVSHNIDTVSKNLAYFIRAMLIRLGYVVSLKIQERESIVYRLRWTLTGKNRIGWMDDDHFYIRIGLMKKEKYKGMVYDLSVSDNHNYCNYWLGKNTGEGFGLPIIESMACGVPNICTNYTTAEELIGKNGELVDLAKGHPHIAGQLNTDRALIDIDDMVAKMNKLYDNPELRKKYSENGRKYVLENYGWEKVCRMWMNLLEHGDANV